MQFQWIDLVIIGVIGLSSLTGLFRGVIKEVIALGVWIVGIWMGYHYAPSLTPHIKPYITNPTAQTAVAFIIILLGVLIAGSIINFILGLILKRSGLGSMDKIFGMGFGFARGVFIVSLILSVLKMTSLPYQQYTQNSALCAQLQPVVNWISGYIPLVLNQIKSVDNGASGKIGNLIDTVPHP